MRRSIISVIIVGSGLVSCVSAPKITAHPSEAVIVSRSYVEAGDSTVVRFSPKKKGLIVIYREHRSLTATVETSSVNLYPVVLGSVDPLSELYPKTLRLDAYWIEGPGEVVIKLKNDGEVGAHHMVVYDPRPAYIHRALSGWGRLAYGCGCLVSLMNMGQSSGGEVWVYTTHDSLPSGALGVVSLICQQSSGLPLAGTFHVGAVGKSPTRIRVIKTKNAAYTVAYNAKMGGIYEYKLRIPIHPVQYLLLSLFGLEMECFITSFNM